MTKSELLPNSKINELLEKLNKQYVDNDKEFLDCLINLDDRLKLLEKNHTPPFDGEQINQTGD